VLQKNAGPASSFFLYDTRSGDHLYSFLYGARSGDGLLPPHVGGRARSSVDDLLPQRGSDVLVVVVAVAHLENGDLLH
jgi:hypothetical protein